MKIAHIQKLQAHIGQPLKGHIPGFASWLNGSVKAITETGDLQLDFKVREEMLNPMGNMHGGAIAAVIDEILGFQLFLKAPEETAYVSMTMNIDFLRAARPGEVLTAIPEVIRIGNKIANVSCVIVNVAGKRVAQGTSNFMRVQ